MTVVFFGPEVKSTKISLHFKQLTCVHKIYNGNEQISTNILNFVLTTYKEIHSLIWQNESAPLSQILNYVQNG